MRRNCRRVVKAIGSTIRSTARAFPIGIKGRLKDTIVDRIAKPFNRARPFADEQNKGDRISAGAASRIAQERPRAAESVTAVGLAIAALAVKDWEATGEALANSAAAVAPIGAAPEVAAVPFRALEAEVARRAASASAAAPAWEALGAVVAVDPAAALAEAAEVVPAAGAEQEVEAAGDDKAGVE